MRIRDVESMPRDRQSDDGLTLVELLVGMVISTIVLVTIVGIVITITTTERTVSDVTRGATAAQSTAFAITERIRNGTDEFEVTAVGADQLLVTATAGRGATLEWQCAGWYYSAEGEGAIYQRVTPPTQVITAPTRTQLATWTVLINGVVAPESGAVFSRNPDGSLSVEFEALAGGSPPILIDFTTAPLAVAAEGEYACF